MLCVDNHSFAEPMQSANKQLHSTETALARVHDNLQRVQSEGGLPNYVRPLCSF